MSSSPNLLSSSEPHGFDWLMDVPALLEVALGTTTLTVRECARLAPGSIVRLRQAEGTDLELRLAGRPFAAGEIIVADDTTALRISRILPPAGGDAA